MATAAVVTNIESHANRANGSVEEETGEKLTFNPKDLEARYQAERAKRINNGGIQQYHFISKDTSLANYIEDPYVDPNFSREPVDVECEAVIIGGGYGGLLTAVRLLERGITNIRIIEKGGDFGGTWYWNRYPGAQCDIESYIYMPLLEELNYVPTEKYAHEPELIAHAQNIGKKYNLYPQALFRTEVLSLDWDNHDGIWSVQTNRDDKIRTRFVMPAAGPLHRPKLPGIPGLESFKGHSFHSSRWDYDYTSGDVKGGLEKLKTKRVGIIGTGATAVQIVPYLAEWSKELYVFQRTPSSIDVRGNTPTDEKWAKTLEKGWQRDRMDNFNVIVNGGYQEKDLVHDGWTHIFAKLFSSSSYEGNLDPTQLAQKMQLADYKKMEAIRARVDALVQDKATAESLKPWYNQFCKRPCFHDKYLQTFNRPNVTLVDTKGAGVTKITPEGIVANGIDYPLDLIVYATGFELSHDWAHHSGIEIYGRDGLTISEKWKNGVETLHGWTSRGFPNCFFVSHLQAALTPNFMHFTNEQAQHIAYVVSEARKRGEISIEPTKEAEDAWVKEVLEKGAGRADFNAKCTPGYFNQEGQVNLKLRKNAEYGAGALAFREIIHEWKQDGKLAGLEIRTHNPTSSAA